MKPLDLLTCAHLLVDSGKGKPPQANLKRAMSSAYYAMFHYLARTSADLLVGGRGAEKSKPAWRQVYRAVEHNATKTACRDRLMSEFPKAIEDFANTFVLMQIKRHAADYDPFYMLTKSEVTQDINVIQGSIEAFSRVPIKDRRAFCAFILFKKRI